MSQIGYHSKHFFWYYRVPFLYSMDDSHRPVKLRKVVLGFPKGNNYSEFRFDFSLNYKLSGIIQTYSDRKPTLVVRTIWYIMTWYVYEPKKSYKTLHFFMGLNKKCSQSRQRSIIIVKKKTKTKRLCAPCKYVKGLWIVIYRYGNVSTKIAMNSREGNRSISSLRLENTKMVIVIGNGLNLLFYNWRRLRRCALCCEKFHAIIITLI